MQDARPPWRRPRTIAGMGVCAAGLLLLRVALWRPAGLVGDAPRDGLERVGGVVHVHTTSSDGSGTPQEVIAAARAAGLSFVVLTDHNNLDAKPYEGYHDGVLALVGTEVSTASGHVLGLGIPDPVFRFSQDARDALEDIRDLGGFSFIAHPSSPVDTFRWTGWGEPGAWGIEILNGDSQWRAAGWARLLKTAALYGVNRRYALLGSLTPPAATLEGWDALLRERDVPGIAGADAHSRVPLRRDTAVRFPSYASLFALVQNHVLVEKPLTGASGPDGRAIIEALSRGRSYVGLDALAPASGFYFVAEREGRRWTMGDTVPAGPGLTLRAGGALPAGARALLLRDGAALVEGDRIEVVDVGPGVYRVEVRIPGWDVPWIVSNPVYVFDAKTVVKRGQRAAWPAQAEPSRAVVVLDEFEGRTAFVPEFDPASSMARDVIDAHAGPDGRAAARMAFTLGVPRSDRPHVWCALVNREKRDLSGRSGLVFSIKGDGVYRLWVQVRDENPASADGGTEWWFASVRTTLEWRRLALPFGRFRSINKATDGCLDLDRVRELVFVVDAGAAKPGTSGTIWLDELGVY